MMMIPVHYYNARKLSTMLVLLLLVVAYFLPIYVDFRYDTSNFAITAHPTPCFRYAYLQYRSFISWTRCCAATECEPRQLLYSPHITTDENGCSHAL